MSRAREVEASFRTRFKVGDIIASRRGYPMRITAIGYERFLWCDAAWPRGERVSKIFQYGLDWRKWDPSIYPDSQYAYVLERKTDPWAHPKIDPEISLSSEE